MERKLTNHNNIIHSENSKHSSYNLKTMLSNNVNLKVYISLTIK